MLLLLDVLAAHSEVLPRVEKGLVKDHKIGGQSSRIALVLVLV